MMIMNLWKNCSRFPMGRCLFSFLLGKIAPYTGTISPEVLSLEAGKVSVRMKDRRKVRNHLNSIHAIALMNLGEVASGLSVVSGLPKNARAIITRLEIEYLKKARGTLTATAEFRENWPDKITESKNCEVAADIKNEDGISVARVKAYWLVGPGKDS